MVTCSTQAILSLTFEVNVSDNRRRVQPVSDKTGRGD